MSDKQLRLQVVFAALDKLTGPLKKITGESSALGKAIKANNDRLKELNAQQKDVGRFRELGAGLQTATGKLREPIKGFFSDLWNTVGNAFNRAWTSIKVFAGGLWNDIKTAFDGGIGGVTALILNWSLLGLFYKVFAGVMGWFGVELPSKFSDFGLNIMQGLANGITGALGTVKAAIGSASDSVIGWFKEKLGIHSPSRVFAELGDFTMQGLAVGLQRSQDSPLDQVGGLAKRLTQIGAGIAIGAASMPALAFDTRPPIAPRATGAGMVIQGDTIQITVTASPGMDEQAIARAVAQALDQRDRQKAARIRSSLSDNHY